MLNNKDKNINEIVKQVVSLKEFYIALGIDSVNTINIFNNTISYLKGELGFDKASNALKTLIEEDKLVTERELDLLNCLDELIHSTEEARKGAVNKLNSSNFDTEYKQIA
ncbi:MAG: hypothetical protein MK033_08055 [Candidatus Caenarcaniphilales bacterium]|nr:hypothetical protein [Candidatus Caenarcaniphilales bacterium]